ncbi:MAG: insulinase family protein [Alphaproteobacteria bacterium]|nr:insulinase family protein [Alphaproteobacteria bacterium]
MKTIALALSLALSSNALAAEGPKRASKPDLRANVPEYSLNTRVFYCPSGLTVMFQEDHSHPIVSIMSIVDHGSGDDPEGKEGTAHFVEHTWFRSTQTVEMGWDEEGNPKEVTLPSIMQTLNDYGTLMNATTRKDWTDYRTVFASEHLDLFLQLESRRLTSPYVGVTEDFIDTEREVIRNEWRRRNEQGFSMLFDFLYSEVYPENHPYHSSSTKETLGRVDLATLQKYFDDYYHPENTTIAIVGDFDLREATSLLFKNFDPKVIDPRLEEKHIFRYPAPGVNTPDRTNPDHWWFGAYDPATYDGKPEDRVAYDSFLIPADDEGEHDQAKIDERRRIKPGEPREPVPERPNKEVAYKKAPIDNRVVIVAWSLPGGFREDHMQLEMLGGIANIALAQYFNSSNFRIYREEWRDSDILGSQCFVQAEKINSTLMCLVEVPNKRLNPEQIAEKIVDQIPFIWNPDLVQIFERSFPRTRQERLVNLLNSVDRVAYHFGGRAEDIVTYAHYTGSPKYHSAAMNQTMTLKMFDVAKLASENLTRDRAVTVVIDPLPKNEIDNTGGGAGYAGASEGDSVIEANSDFAKLTDDDVRNAYVKPDLSGLREETFENGLEVIILPHGEAPVAYSALVFHGGNLTGEQDRNYFMWAFSDSNAIKSWQFDDGEDPLQIAGYYSEGLRDEYHYYALRHAAGNVDGALWMLREHVDGMAPDVSGKKSFVGNYKGGIKASWTSSRPDWLIGEYMDKHDYPENPERWDTSWEGVGKLLEWGPDQVNESLANLHQPQNATLIITGKIDPDQALENAKKYFGGWQAKSGAVSDTSAFGKIATPAMSDGSKILIFDDPKRTQTQISGSCRLNFDDDKRSAVAVLSSIFFSEVFTRLRVKEGLAYSPVGFAREAAGNAAALGFNSLAVNDGVGRTLEVMKELVRRGEAGEFDEQMVRIHKLREARNSGLESQSTDQIGTRLRGYASRDWSVKGMLNNGDNLANVSPDQIKDLMTGCGDRLIFTLHGPAEVIKPQLDKLNYDYEVVDWKGEGEARFQKYDPKGFKKYLKQKAKKEAKEAAAEDGAASAE